MVIGGIAALILAEVVEPFGKSTGMDEITVYSRCGGLLKWWYPQIIRFNRVFHYKPSILGYPYFFGNAHVFFFKRWFVR